MSTWSLQCFRKKTTNQPTKRNPSWNTDLTSHCWDVWCSVLEGRLQVSEYGKLLKNTWSSYTPREVSWCYVSSSCQGHINVDFQWEVLAIGGWLDWMILQVFSSLGDAMILWFLNINQLSVLMKDEIISVWDIFYCINSNLQYFIAVFFFF